MPDTILEHRTESDLLSDALNGVRAQGADGTQALPGALPCFLVLFGLAIALTLATPIPAMVDYPNHLARMHLLARDAEGIAHPHYRVAWAFYPNLAMDLIVPPLGRIVGIETASRLFLLASQVLIVTGAIALEWAVKRRFHLAGLVALFALTSVPFAWGFTNFTFGLGLALWGIAVWLVLPDRAWAARFVLHASFATLTFVAHLFSLGIYGFALGLHEAWRLWSGRASLAETALRLTLLAAPALVLAALMLALGGSVGQAGNVWFWAFKPFWLVGVFNGYDLRAGLLGGIVLVGLVAMLARRRALGLHGSGGFLLAGFAILYLAMPGTLLDTAFVDLRLVVAVLLILPAFLTLRLSTQRRYRALTGALPGLVALNLAVTAHVWTSYRAEYATLIASFDRIAKGSRVLIGHSGAGDDPPLADLPDYPIYNAPTLAAHYADALVPTLFTAAGKQPLTVRPESRALAVPYGGPVPMAILAAIAEGRIAPPTYFGAWTRDFDYLYVVGPQAENPLPTRLEALAGTGRFTLYRVRKTP